MAIKNLISIVTCFFLLLNANLSNGSCLAFYQGVIEELVSNADYYFFQKAKEKYVSQFTGAKESSSEKKDEEISLPTNKNEALAFLASLEARGVIWNYDFSRFYQDSIGGSEKAYQKRLLKKIEWLTEAKQLSVHQIYKLAGLMYLVSNPPTSTFARYEDLQIRTGHLIRQRFFLELTTNKFFEAMENLGLIRDHRILDNARFRAAVYSEYLKPVLMLALVAPNISLLNAKVMDNATFEHVYSLYRESGGDFNAIRPFLEKYYGNRTNFDFTWMWIRKVYTTLAVSTLVALTATEGLPAVIEHGPNAVKAVPQVVRHIKNYSVPTLMNRFGWFKLDNKAAIQELLLNEWIEASTFFTGKPPVPTDAAYIQKYKEIYESNDLELYLTTQKQL